MPMRNEQVRTTSLRRRFDSRNNELNRHLALYHSLDRSLYDRCQAVRQPLPRRFIRHTNDSSVVLEG